MKTQTITFVITLLLVYSCNGNANFSESKIQSIKQSQLMSLGQIQSSDTMLNGIEKKIYSAFVKGNISKTDTDISNLEADLLTLYKKKNNSIIAYWNSYTCYYHSILSTIQKDTKKAEKEINAGIDLIEDIETKTSEHYALLALMESYSIQFSAGIKAPFISASVKKNG